MHTSELNDSLVEIPIEGPSKKGQFGPLIYSWPLEDNLTQAGPQESLAQRIH